MKIKFSASSYFAAVLFSFIFILGFFLRSKNLFSGDFLFLPDQARDLILVRDMILANKLPLIGARVMSGGLFFHGPLWIWMLGIPFFIFKGNPYFISWTFVLISMAIVVAGSFIALRLYGLKVGLLVGLFLVGSSALLGAVPGTTNAQVLPLVFVFYLYCLIIYLRGNKKALYYAAFLAGLGIHFEGIFSALLFPFLFFVSVFTDRYIANIKRAIIALIAFFLPLTTYLLFDLRHQFLMTKGLIRFLTPGTNSPIKGYEQYANIGFRVYDRLANIINMPYAVLPGNDKLLFILLIISLFGTFWLVFDKKASTQFSKEFIVLLSLPIYIYLLYIFFPYPIWEQYVFSIPVIVSFIFALSISQFSRYRYGWTIGIIIVILLLIPIKYKLQIYYFSNSQSEYANSDGLYTNQLRVVDYIFKDANGQKFGYFVYAPQVFTYGMDYLLWWRGKYKYKYLPDSKKNKIFYLIMYPPLVGDEGAHRFWIKNTIRTKASVLGRKEFRGRIIVEKRSKAPNNETEVDPNYYLNVR